MKWINGFGRPLLVLAAILPGVAWGAPGGLGPGGRREIRTAPAPSADALKVSLLGGKDPLILEVRGEGAARYQMTVGPEGRVSFHFPGAKLLPAGGIQDDRFLRQALQSPGSLVLPGSPSHLLGLEARPSYLRIEIKAVRAPEEARISQYRIGIGDKIRINIYGDEEFNDKGIRVVGNGRISVPYLGEIKAAGLTSKELADELGKRLAEGYLVDPKVSVEVQEYMSQWVHVSGEVQKPGRFYLKGPTRLVDIIAEAGGLKKEAGTDVRVTRPDAGGHANELLTVTRDELYLSDNEETNPLLRSGDTVTVSAQEHFFIKGQVKSPGRYPVDRGTTILRAISLAGGFGEYANQKKIELLRAKDGEMVRLVINVEKIEKRKAEDILVLPGDIINVKAKFL